MLSGTEQSTRTPLELPVDPTDAVDEADFARRSGPGQWDLLSAALSVLLGESPQMLTRIRAALDVADATVVREVAHAMKGAASAAAATRLAGLCLTLERQANADHLEHSPAVVTRIAEEVTRVQAWQTARELRTLSSRKPTVGADAR